MKINILIVDDEEDIRKTLKRLLEKYLIIKAVEIEVHEADNADRALKIAREKLFHVVLLDIVMPGETDAFEFLKKIKEINKLTQVIMITGNSTFDRVLEAIEEGADDYLLKPFDKETIIESLKCTIRKIKNWKQAFKLSL
ncbi:MAG: response regulator [Candidatus Hodarchaeales archaeon]